MEMNLHESGKIRDDKGKQRLLRLLIKKIRENSKNFG